MHAFDTPSSRWQAVVARELAADGRFVYCVRTTGIYCRPICKARCARRANVEFHIDANVAEAAGFRACKRCQPQLLSYTPESDKIAKALEAIDSLAPGQALPPLEHLARCAGLTKHHFHRSFKRTMGVTPREYLLLKRGANLTKTASQASTTDSSSVSTPLPWPQTESLHDMRINDIAPASANPAPAGPQPVLVSYAIRDTALGLLTMAFHHGQACKLELCDSISDAIIELESTFPLPAYMLSCLDTSPEGHTMEVDSLNARVTELVEAMERPCGRMVDVPSSISVVPANMD